MLLQWREVAVAWAVRQPEVLLLWLKTYVCFGDLFIAYIPFPGSDASAADHRLHSGSQLARVSVSEVYCSDTAARTVPLTYALLS